MTSMPQESAEIFKQDQRDGSAFPRRDKKRCWTSTNEAVAAPHSLRTMWHQILDPGQLDSKAAKTRAAQRSLLKQGEGAGEPTRLMAPGSKRLWKRARSQKRKRVRCGFTLRPGPTVRLAMLERAGLAAELLRDALEPEDVELQRESQDFVLLESCDMRKGFNGLYGMVSTNFGEDPKSGALFVFSNRRHTRIKILYFDGSGLWLLTKRLERAPSGRRSSRRECKAKLTPEALAMLTDGVDLRGAKLRPWYERQ